MRLECVMMKSPLREVLLCFSMNIERAFVLITELVLRPLLSRWCNRGSGWTLDGLHVSAVCYADDIILVSSCKADLHRMLHEVVEAFLEVGLSIGARKTHWSSFPAHPGTFLDVLGVHIPWEPDLTFVGTIISPSGSETKSIDYRMAQANKALGT